jgi:hypothetical protein
LAVEAEAPDGRNQAQRDVGQCATADEFAAIRSAGFEPAGQVLGAAVYNVGYTGGYNCPGPFGDGGISPDRSVTQVSGRGRPGSFGPLVRPCTRRDAPPSPG